jgi:hypothetical protein
MVELSIGYLNMPENLIHFDNNKHSLEKKQKQYSSIIDPHALFKHGLDISSPSVLPRRNPHLYSGNITSLASHLSFLTDETETTNRDIKHEQRVYCDAYTVLEYSRTAKNADTRC